ncbi:hypothetical protein MBAV_002588 [Candidatus Magnetobacterium bavaricum]|uniref:Uncharacterized protein n=1 Tax=Candidatus Magnetobacterium bavaricum TaxID=29290 RepID=A0A0F3GTF8_9BACT|nr:hypothetical protein MBAV_002588 [Candidatus Magnetobacterium bavaricum]
MEVKMKDEDSVTGTVECLEAGTIGNEKTAKITTCNEAVHSSESISHSITHDPRESILAMLRFDPNRIAALMAGIAE